MNNEQWKTDGDCSKCRRKNYCKEKCKAYKNGLLKDVSEAFFKTRTGQFVNMVNDKLIDQEEWSMEDEIIKEFLDE